MAIVVSSNAALQPRGKIGGLVYSLQPNGKITVRSVGERRAPVTEGEKRVRNRFRLAQRWARNAMLHPELRAAYELEGKARKLLPRDVAFSDFLSEPVIVYLEVLMAQGPNWGNLLVVTGDDFKVIRVRVEVINAKGLRQETGFAESASASNARIWVYAAQTSVAGIGQVILDVEVTDRCGHSTSRRVTLEEQA